MSHARRTTLVLSILAAALVAVLFLVRTDRREDARAERQPQETASDEAARARTPLAAPAPSGPRAAGAPTEPTLTPAAQSSESVSATPAPAPRDPDARGRIFGRVLGPDARPAVGRTVHVLRTPTGPSRKLETNADGVFDGADFPAAKYHVSTKPDEEELKALGLRTSAAGIEWLSQTTLVLAAGAEVEVNLGTPPARAIRVHGRVVGAPASTPILQWVPEGEDGYNRARYVGVKEDGAYEILLSEPGRYRLSAILDMPAVRADEEVVVPDASEFEWNLSVPDGRVAVLVEGPGHVPLKGARVDLVPCAGVSPIPFMSCSTFSRATDAQGRVTFESLRPGEWLVAIHGVTLPGEAKVAAAATTREIVVRGGGNDAEILVELEPGHVVRGLVRAEDGTPGTGTDVFVFDERGRPLTPLLGERTDKAGEFELTGLMPGAYRACGANGDRWTDSVAFRVEPARALPRLELTLRPAARLEVELPTTTVPCWIDVRDEFGSCLSAVLDRNLYSAAYGRGSSTRTAKYWLPRGNYDVRALTPGRVEHREHVALLPGANATVRW